ncbi:MAG: GWxTD domain-containing protein [Chitinophagaceae bacterium]|nr:GWxTD domain-containing protein [Chitinophagaceae bacterium]
MMLLNRLFVFFECNIFFSFLRLRSFSGRQLYALPLTRILLLTGLLYGWSARCAAAADKDSIVSVVISNKMAGHEVVAMEYAFFDMDDNRIYYQLALSGTSNLKSSSFLYLEIKKKTNIQYKLKPLYAKKILLDSLHQLVYRDSFLLQDVRLASGNFDLIISLMNDSSKVLDAKKAGFQLLRNANEKIIDEYYELEANVKGNIVDLEKTFVAKYDQETLKRNISSLRPIAEGIETKVISDMASMNDMKFLRQFFFNFWFNRNASDPEAEWKKYAEKLNYVARQYGTANRPGYETDRGRIYITYGEPQKIERVPSEKDALPYEIWFYKYVGNKSNISFLFFQPGMVGSQMFLLHSNYDEEIRNPYWKETLLLDPGNTDNKLTHRVYEYFK